MSNEAEAAIGKARAGDMAAFQSLVERHSRDVFRLAFRITRNEMDAEDAVQETFLKAHQKLGGFDGRSSFGTWLYRITANTSIDVLRRRRREEGRSDSLDDETAAQSRRLATEDPSPDRLLFSTEVKARLRVALDELTEMERAAFAMRHFEGFPLTENQSNPRPQRKRHQASRVSRRQEGPAEPRTGYEDDIVKHLNEDQLILYYYGESPSPETDRLHLDACTNCRSQLDELGQLLAEVVAEPVPERPADYGQRVWRRVERELSAPKPRWSWAEFFRPRNLVWAAAAASILVAVFLAGRFSTRLDPELKAPSNAQVRERILLVALTDHLESTQILLMELVNNPARSLAEQDGPRTIDISFERRMAENLVGQNRLYRQTANRNGDAAAASVLDELERMLVEIAHSPDEIDGNELEQLRRRIEEQGVLFKVKVLNTNVKERQLENVKRKTL